MSDYWKNWPSVKVKDFVKKMSELLRSPTWNQKNLCFFLQMFCDVTFHPNTISTNMTKTTETIWLLMWKRQLRHGNVKSVENISRRNKNYKTCAKKTLSVFWFLFGDFNISNIFYKIQNLNEWQLVSVIIHWPYTFLNAGWLPFGLRPINRRPSPIQLH